MRSSPLAAVIAASLLLGGAVPALAADPVELTVTTTSDVTDAGDGLTSLREAVEEADAVAGGYVIHLPAGTYLLDGELDVGGHDAEVVLRGAGAAATTIDAQGVDRHMTLTLARLRLEDMELTGGLVVDQVGGAILARGSQLYLDGVHVRDNAVHTEVLNAGFSGGAVSVAPLGVDAGYLDVTDSVFEGNAVVALSDQASELTGGALAIAGDAAFHIETTRFTANTLTAFTTTQGLAGAALSVRNLPDGFSAIHRTTFDGNDMLLPPGHTGFVGGAAMLLNDNNGDTAGHEIRTSNLTLEANGDSAPGVSTIYAWNAPMVVGFEHLTLRTSGIGISAGTGVVDNLENSVIVADSLDCAGGDPTSGGGNVISDDSCGAGGPSDATETDPGLGAFDATTTPVPVVRLATGSAALDHAVLEETDTDARGLPRPAGPAPDSGAFEHQGPTAVDDVAATDEDTPVVVAVTANDLPGDAALAPASVTITAAPSQGTATAASDGTVTFTPAGTGGFAFDYQVCQQGFAMCDTATVTATVTAADDPTDEPTDDPTDEPTDDPTEPAEQGVVRRAGQDRYETAVLASRAAFDPGIEVAYVATGEAFPDALAGAPLAARDGAPILLTRPDELPATTADELDRLAPGRIVVLGGPVAVSDEVEQALGAHTAGPVTRLRGPDRYATAARIAEAFTATDGTVYLATAQNFPDALAGAAAAGRDGAPILLVSASELPTATAAQLSRLAPATVVVLGGRGVVADGVLDAVRDLVGTMPTRLAGVDRFATAAAVSATFPTADTVYLATGMSFPDALAGAPIAGAEPGPILLTQPDELPAAAAAELDRLQPTRIVLLGGEAAVGTAVAAALEAHLGA